MNISTDGTITSDMRKVAGDYAEFLTVAQVRELLALRSGERPRMYGYIVSGQIVKLSSMEYFDRYSPLFMWLSGTEVSDLVSRA